MIQKLRQRMANDESAFTLVELLVVMLIIGLLAAIAIPSFFNQRDKAKDSSAKEAVRTAQTAVETFSTDKNGSYLGVTAPDLKTIEQSLNSSPGSTVAVGTGADLATKSSFKVTVTSTTGNTFSIARASDGTLTYACTVADTSNRGGCPTSNTWN